MDIYMPHGDGLTATKEIRERYPAIAVVMLTSSENDEHLYQAVKLGVSGYLLKSLDAKELFELLAGIPEGEAAMTKSMATRILNGIAKRSMSVDKIEDALTERELIVLRLVASGDSNSKIAEELSVSVNTVKGHLKNILSKLQLENRTQAATFAVKSGLVSE
jgi:DNA-binding NarL/FixJ family response regulator